MTNADFEWIDRADVAADWSRSAAASSVLGIDTEFMRQHTFWPELALFQVAAGGRIVLLDPLAEGAGAAIATVLASPAVKIMHSASEDLVALREQLAAPLAGLFDTQIAAAYAGLGAGIGFQKLVLALLGRHVDKGETRSNWLARPLTPSQRAYAADDVRPLAELHALLVEKLDARGMLLWCMEDCIRMAATSFAAADEPNPHWFFRNAPRWSPARRALAWRLCRFRDLTARAIDRPKSWILDDAAIAQIADAGGELDDAALSALIRLQRSFPKRETARLRELIAEAPSTEELALPPPPAPLDDAQERQLRALRDAVAAKAAELDLPAPLLASRRLQEAVVRDRGTPELSGWRRQIIAPLL